MGIQFPKAQTSSLSLFGSLSYVPYMQLGLDHSGSGHVLQHELTMVVSCCGLYLARHSLRFTQLQQVI